MRSGSDLLGKRFGYLTVIRRDGNRTTMYRYRNREKEKRSNRVWLCRCDCGVEVSVRGDALVLGRRKSCAVAGHRWLEYMNDRPRGITTQYASEYKSWEKMLDRCGNRNNDHYKDYGARGIAVCPRWQEFKFFLEDMGPKPAAGYTIERKDVNGNYELGNCRWATRKEQSRNQRRSVYVQLDGERQLLLDVTHRLGLNRQVVYQRLKLGWSLDDALGLPVRAKKKKT